MKLKGLSNLLLASVIATASTVAQAAPSLIPAAPDLAASGYILIDADSGKVLVEKNADEKLPPASLTKMMTGYVLSHELAQGTVRADEMANISHNAWAQNPVFKGSSLMWIEVGTKVPVKDLYRGLVISSGNDASVAIAEHVAGGENAFADIMNQHAEVLGMNDTHFVNSHGLPAENHYTTARDLGVLAKAIIANPEHYAVYAEREYSYNGITQSNRNELLGEEGVDGLKTGHTEEAGYCLVSSAKRKGMRLISVVMGTKSKLARKTESRKLLTYGFRFYETLKLAANDAETVVPVWGGEANEFRIGPAEDVYLTIPRGKANAIVSMASIDEVIKAPIEVGQQFGTLKLMLNDEVISEQALVALEAVPQAGLFARLWDAIVLFFTQLLQF